SDSGRRNRTTALGAKVAEILRLRIRTADRVVIDRFREGIRRVECQVVGEPPVGAQPKTVVVGIRNRLLGIDAAEAGNRADAVDALVPIANDPQVMSPASDIRRLE